MDLSCTIRLMYIHPETQNGGLWFWVEYLSGWQWTENQSFLFIGPIQTQNGIGLIMKNRLMSKEYFLSIRPQVAMDTGTNIKS